MPALADGGQRRGVRPGLAGGRGGEGEPDALPYIQLGGAERASSPAAAKQAAASRKEQDTRSLKAQISPLGSDSRGGSGWGGDPGGRPGRTCIRGRSGYELRQH
jgi:hypothetical protein